MIAFLQGTVQSKELNSLIIKTGGVGYFVSMPLRDLMNLKEGQVDTSVYIHTHVREDALDLYGFLDKKSLFLFKQLIAINGVGPKLALTILSSTNPSDLEQIIATENLTSLTKIPGVGKKTAQRMLIDLKGKLVCSDSSDTELFSSPLRIMQDVKSAIANLGYREKDIEIAVKTVMPLAKQGKPLESLLKESLKYLNNI